MEYEEVMYNLYVNKKLNENGLMDYIGVLHRRMLDNNLPIAGLTTTKGE